jgi:orotidine-5'-phosphate decarboxylase
MTGPRHKPELILALDVDTSRAAVSLVEELSGLVGIFKVGLQLFTAVGPDIVQALEGKGARVFLDLKFHDIPNTVAQAVRQAVRKNVFMLTVHTSGGIEMMKAAADAARDEASLCSVRRPLLIGVTVLTSREASAGEVAALARMAVSSGLDGVVSSAREAAQIRLALGEECRIVTPGIRQAGAVVHDQKRTATVGEAVKAGSDFLVVGRPILQAENPRSAVQALLGELDAAYQLSF